MSFIHSIILGIVEGITEFLPISSTGHLIFASKILNILETDFIKSFLIIIQCGAILAVVWIYRKKIFPFDIDLWTRIITSFIPTAVIGFILYKLIKNYLLGSIWITAVALIIGGIILIIFEKWNEKRNPEAGEILSEGKAMFEMKHITYKQAFLIGLFQALAVIPGVSRSGATIVSGQALGMSRRSVVEYSFLLAIPTVLAASGYDFLKNAHSFVGNEMLVLAIGFVVSFVTALLVVKLLLRYIRTHNFVYFGIYRIIIGIIFLFFL